METKIITARATEDVYEQIRKNAEENGLSISCYLIQSGVQNQVLSSTKEKQLVRQIIQLQNFLQTIDDDFVEIEEMQERITELWRTLNA